MTRKPEVMPPGWQIAPDISSVSDLKAAITQNGEPSGDFRFGLTRSFDDTALARPIQNVRTKFPKLKLHAFVQFSGSLLESLANRKLDAAMVKARVFPGRRKLLQVLKRK